jgi:Flp pilus assembly protein TadG
MAPWRRRHGGADERSGTTLVEMALVLPVFFLFVFAIIEFGHAYLVIGTMTAAVKKAARMGAADGVTTDDVIAKVEDILGGAIDLSDATIMVKDASVFDTEDVDADSISYSGLPDINLEEAADTQLFVVRIEVPYDDVALLPPFWAGGMTLHSESVMRHE